MTARTIQAGYILAAGSVLILVGAFFAWGVRDWWSERQATKAERIIGSPAPFAHSLDAGGAEYEQHVADALAMVERASVTALPGRRIASVPQQGTPSRWS